MNKFLAILCFIGSVLDLSSQCCTPEQACNFRTINVANGPATSLQLVHTGPVAFQPVLGQQTNWILGTSANPALTNVTTAAANGSFIFNLTALGITTSDVIAVSCIITNTNGSVCSILNETIVWTLVNAGTNTFLWRVTPPAVTGVFSQTPLAVDWLSFDGKRSKNHIQLHWSTATELNNEGYQVLASTDSQLWKQVGFVDGRGNASSTSDYTFAHTGAPNTILYYKLIQVDYDGIKNESETIVIDNTRKVKDVEFLHIYPNPSNGMVTVDLGTLPIASAFVKIYNSVGQIIMSKEEEDLNNPVYSIDLPTKGLYLIHVSKDGHEQVSRIVVK
jgi:hypothetical protein